MTTSDFLDREGARSPDDGPSETLMELMSVAKSSSVKAGAEAPLFNLRTTDGQKVSLGGLIRGGPLVLSIYRGTWCSYCCDALESLSSISEAVRDLGASLLAVGAPPADERERAYLDGLGITAGLDPSLSVARCFGLTVVLPIEDRPRYLSLGFSPAAHWRVAIPATFVIDRSGRVVLSSVDADYRQRLGVEHILSTLRSLKEREARRSAVPATFDVLRR